QLSDPAIGKWILLVLHGNKLFDESADRGARCRTTRIGGHMAAEEILELEDAERRRHELVGRDAGDGRFVQADGVGDLAQHQRTHGDLAVTEEVVLAIDDRLRNPQDGVEPLLDVADQPARFLQPLRPRRVPFRSLIAFDDRRIGLVHSQPGHHFRVQLRSPPVPDPADENIRYYMFRRRRGKAYAWMRIQSTNQLVRTPQLVVAAIELLT